MTTPVISLVVLTYGNLELSKACVESLRAHTDLPHELIVVDNGSTPDAAEWAHAVADRVIINSENRGFAVGMNQGLAIATGELVAFINNDTSFPAGWASTVAETMSSHPRAGIVAPAVTAAGNPATVRSVPGGEPVIFEPFGHLPSGVVYVMHTDVARALGGWNEDYHLATGEDLDLLFTVWCNDLEVILEPRVLVEHVSEASRRAIPAMGHIQRVNLQRFLDRWKTAEPLASRLDTCPPEVMSANLRHAAAAAWWLERLVGAREDRGPGTGANPVTSEASARINALETQVTRLKSRLDSEQDKLARLMGRTSVRLALSAADLARPVLRIARRRHPVPAAEPRQPDQAHITAELRRLRSGSNLGNGPLVSIVMLNRDGVAHLARLLPGLATNTAYRPFELIVVDNASTDASRTLLTRDWGFPVKVIENDSNVTFSAGCNQGLDVAVGEYVLLLNNDIEPITPGWLGSMVEVLESDPTLGAAGALLVYPARPGYTSADPSTGTDLTVQHRGIRLGRRRSAEPGGIVPWGYNVGVGEDPTSPHLVETVDVPAATAACLLVRADLARDLGGFDDHYIYGVEDVELCLRIRDAGHHIAVVGAAALYHHEFGTQSRTASAAKRSAGLSNLQHFSETWAPRLSRLLDLEALEPGPQWLHQRPSPVLAVTTTDSGGGHAGEHLVAHDLGDALASVGYSVVYAGCRDGVWTDLTDDVAVVICLEDSFDPRTAPPDTLTVAWVRSRADNWIARPWFGRHDVYVPADRTTSDQLMAAGTAVTEIVPPATNPNRFHPRPPNPLFTADVAVVADHHDAVQAGIEGLIVRPGERVSIYGGGWEAVGSLARYTRGSLPDEHVPEVYASARVVVDERSSELPSEFGSSQTVFDALASGTVAITNDRAVSEDCFQRELPTYADQKDQRRLLDRLLSDEAERSALAERLRARVLADHTYTRRATQIPTAVRALLGRPRVAIKIGVTNEDDLLGESDLAKALFTALLHTGTRPQIHTPDAWDLPASQSVDAVIHIRGPRVYVPKPAHVNVMWVTDHPAETEVTTYQGYDLVLASSESSASALRTLVDVPVGVMDPAPLNLDRDGERLMSMITERLTERHDGALGTRRPVPSDRVVPGVPSRAT